MLYREKRDQRHVLNAFAFLITPSLVRLCPLPILLLHSLFDFIREKMAKRTHERRGKKISCVFCCASQSCYLTKREERRKKKGGRQVTTTTRRRRFPSAAIGKPPRVAMATSSPNALHRHRSAGPRNETPAAATADAAVAPVLQERERERGKAERGEARG